MVECAVKTEIVIDEENCMDGKMISKVFERSGSEGRELMLCCIE